MLSNGRDSNGRELGGTDEGLTMKQLMTRVALAAVFSTALTSGVLAQDAGDEVFGWGGLYGGIGIGFSAGSLDVTEDDDPATFNFNTGIPNEKVDDLSPDGVHGSAHLGYRFDASGFIFGIEASVDFGSIDDRGGFDNVALAAFDNEFKYDAIARIGGQIGYAAGPVLVYATGGYAHAWFDYEVNLGAIDAASGSDTAHGYYVGAGVEYALTSYSSIGIEYVYTDFEDDSYRFSGGLTPPGNALAADFDDMDLHTIKAKFSVRF